MERIQQALEKARAARLEGQEASELGVTLRAAAEVRRAQVEGSRVTHTVVGAPRWNALQELRPNPKMLLRKHIVTATGEHQAGRFDVLRTKLLHQLRSNGWRRIAVTSPGPSCGKTTVALNLAYGLARQPELRILLADADLRRPSIARALGLRPSVGLPDFLEGRSGLDETAIRVRPNLAVLMTAGPRRNPAELFSAPRTMEALGALETVLDPTVMIFDLPPVLTGDDVLAFAEHVDAALIVAAAGSTSIAEIDACERELAARTNVLGVVLNRCRYMEQEYGYGDYG